MFQLLDVPKFSKTQEEINWKLTGNFIFHENRQIPGKSQIGVESAWDMRRGI